MRQRHRGSGSSSRALAQARAERFGEVLGARELDAEFVDLLGGSLLVLAHAVQQGLSFAVIEAGSGVEAVGGVKEVAHLVEGETERGGRALYGSAEADPAGAFQWDGDTP